MTDIDAALADLAARYALPDIEPDELTLRMVTEALHVTRDTAEARLAAEVAAGRMTVRWVRGYNSKRQKAWRRVK